MSSTASGTSSSSGATSSSTAPNSTRKRRTSRRNGTPYDTLKHRKPMGRPKNGWTPSRRRKLVRLYLMTDLDVTELALTLQSERFKPCKRDVQKQLNVLLQARPNQVRSKGETTKARLRVLRECKSLRSHRYHDSTSSLKTMSEDTLRALSCEVLESSYSTIALTDSLSSAGPDTGSLKLSHAPPMSDHSFVQEVHNLNPDMVPTNLTLSNLKEHEAMTFDTEISPQFGTNAVLLPHDTTNNISPSPRKQDGDNVSLFSKCAKSVHSLISLTSLRRRLLFKHSPSELGDIRSLLGRLTISRSSAISTITKSQTVEAKPLSPIAAIHHDRTIILPGIFPRYCWEHLCNNELIRCDEIRLPCNRGPMFPSHDTTKHQQVETNIMMKIRTGSIIEDEISCVDSFGNSILHIAATIGLPPADLINLINLGADVHLLNNGDQTFLHLVDLSQQPCLRDFSALIDCLKIRGFDFARQDHNGQTALHAILQKVTAWKTRSSIFQSFIGVDIPPCRDNTGCTIRGHLEDQRSELQWPYAEISQMPDDAHDIPLIKQVQSFNHLLKVHRDPYSPNNPSNSSEQTQAYSKHADLLRVMVQAGDYASAEDFEGRNGLHCLAEVRLDLPLNIYKSDTTSPHGLDTRVPSTPWENYMEQLLLTGVNPNSYDKTGDTPLIAFVTHWSGKNESLTSRLLERLINGGASVNFRNRAGESPLHIAVRLGHRAATKVLLSRGANIHARTNTGEGILSLGTRSLNKAARDEVLYAQISLCVCLVANAGAVSAPTILDEWATPGPRV